MLYAVIEIQGHQYIVKEGDVITVDKFDIPAKETLSIDTVLMTFDEDGSHVKIGTPFVPKARVDCIIADHQKGDKMRIIKFKRKNRYTRTIGFRPKQTLLEIKKINTDG